MPTTKQTPNPAEQKSGWQVRLFTFLTALSITAALLIIVFSRGNH